MKKAARFLLVLALCLALCACGSTPPESIPDAAPAEPTPMEIAEELWADLLDLSVVAEEFLTPGGELMNSILNDTRSSVIDASETTMSVSISYPNAAAKLSEQAAAMPEGFTQEDVDAMYRAIQSAVESGELEYVEVTLELPLVEDEEGVKFVEITPELSVAMTGGIAGIATIE